ncbi:putative pyrroloquinoline-quinone binding quinoprotein [Krasilnikovia cinnamomea]|uniref:Putative pyrroloquinoline-quinone binding quinoprotein n=1 Tax=Krasilnikovia cinnamomea TaxID=349313 RepID=A0A4Q7ZE15_9ACTN|nr:PQQ-binding-like beta-propeller repeat protein [Krasilnikovia cinnamomea]RZU48940.1 putative pyrroloquinoline-quinone binding quinoprotein [Krasilnikovia cinnamomea]
MRAFRALLSWSSTLVVTCALTAAASPAAASPAAASPAAASPAAASPAAADWTHPGYGPGDTYFNPRESVINPRSIDGVAFRWSTGLPAAPGPSCSEATPPLVAAGRLFVADETGIGAYRAATGRLIWHHTWASPGDFRTPHLAVSGGLLLAGVSGCRSFEDPGGRIMALDAATGRERWHVDDGGPVASLLVDRGVVVADGVSDAFPARVRALRVSDGKRRWVLPGYLSGVSANGRLLVHRAYGDGVAAVSVTTGRRLWSKPTGTRIEAATPAGNRFYVTDRSHLICLKASNGSVVWRVPALDAWIGADDRRVYRSVSNGVEALDARNGRRLWGADFEGDAGQPVAAGGLVYTSVDAGEPLGVLNAATGAVASSGTQFHQLDERYVVVSGGRLYLTRRNSLEAYTPS